MSWGERSCNKLCRCPNKCSWETCNVDCPGYEWDGVTPKDTIPFEQKKLEIHGFYTKRSKKGKNYIENQKKRRNNPNIKKIRNGEVVEYG